MASRRSNHLGSLLGAVFGFLATVGVYAACVPPGADRIRDTNTSPAVATLRTITTALVAYRRDPQDCFPASLTELAADLEVIGPDPEEQPILEDTFSKDAYSFTYKPGSADSNGCISTFAISARPFNKEVTPGRSFFTDQSGVIRVTTEDRPAAADDPPILEWPRRRITVVDGLIIIAIFASFVTFIVYWLRKQKDECRRVALELGFDFHDDIRSIVRNLRPVFAHFPLFGRGTRNLAGGVLGGDMGGNDVFLFNYMFKSEDWTTVACFQLRESNLPTFTLSPTPIVDTTDSPFKSEASYELSAPTKDDENAIRSLFDSDSLSCLESDRGWTVESRRGWLVIYKYGQSVKPRQMPIFLEDAKRIVRLLADR